MSASGILTSIYRTTISEAIRSQVAKASAIYNGRGRGCDIKRFHREPLGCVARVSVRGSHTFRMSSKPEAVLIDLSGTLHIEDTPVDGAPEALAKLRASGLKVRFVTNTTKESLRSLHDRLAALHFDIKADDIYTSLTAARDLVKSRNLRPLLYLEDDAKEDFKGINVERPNCVIIGLAPSCFNYKSMNEAFRLLLDGAPLIAIHKARYFKKKDGLYLGPGPFVSGLEYATDTKAEVVGKPEKSFFLDAIRDLNCDPARTVMVGDDVRDDVGGAVEAGMMGILVQTGKYRAGDETKITPGPTAVCPDFPAAVELILKGLHTWT